MDQAGQIDYKKILKGTTTIGLVCSDGVVVGADSRATMDNIIGSSEARKIFKIDGNLAMTIAGGVGDAQELIRIMKVQNEIYKMNEGHPLSPKSAASLASIILQENRMYPLYVWPLIAGMDGDMPQLFNVDPVGGAIEESKFTSVGSGSQAALGYIEDMFKKGISTKDAVKGVARALTIAIRRDSASGDNILIAVINKAGYTEYTGKDLEKVLGTAK
jgi:proteasome beta subunit